MRLVIISGRSGSGKSTALRQLEDEGFYCIDNLPAALLPALLERVRHDEFGSKGLAICIDARNAHRNLGDFPSLLAKIPDSLNTDVIYLDADDDSLIRRFSKTRRKHHLSSGKTTISEAMKAERSILEPIHAATSRRIDTSEMTIYELRSTIRECFADTTEGDIIILFQSFGFKGGLPGDADLVYDVRVLPNPHWEPDLRDKTGKDPEVAAFLASKPGVEAMFNSISSYLDKWLPQYRDNSRSYITVALGCTGGQHRSVYLAERLYRHYSPLYPEVNIRHRELQS